MAQREIELILMRQLASYLAQPIVLVNANGDLLFYNEPAEGILGHRYDETGPMPASEWSTIFNPVDKDGHTIQPEELPLMIAMMKRHPAHRSFWIQALDGTMREIEVTAFPLNVQADRFLGAVAFF